MTPRGLQLLCDTNLEAQMPARVIRDRPESPGSNGSSKAGIVGS
jgi:hypothetical protein